MYKVLHQSNPYKGLFFDVYELNSRAKKTLYFIGPYKGRKYYFYFFFRGMARCGYRIFFLQPHEDVLSTKHLEWLGDSIDQAINLIDADRKARVSEDSFIAGVSLGSYLSLNILLNLRFKKFVGVAGGVPLAEFFRTTYLFRKDLKDMKNAGREHEIDGHWQRFDEAFKQNQLLGTDILLINSKMDRVIRPKVLAEFIKTLRRTNANVINDQKGYLPHTLKSLSLNFQAHKIDKFFK